MLWNNKKSVHFLSNVMVCIRPRRSPGGGPGRGVGGPGKGMGGPGKGGGGGTYPVIITYQIFNFRWTNPIKNEKNDYNDRYLGGGGPGSGMGGPGKGGGWSRQGVVVQARGVGVVPTR